MKPEKFIVFLWLIKLFNKEYIKRCGWAASDKDKKFPMSYTSYNYLQKNMFRISNTYTSMYQRTTSNCDEGGNSHLWTYFYFQLELII